VTEYLDRDDVLTAGAAALGRVPTVRDYGLLDAAVARSQATVVGVDAYPDNFTKAGRRRGHSCTSTGDFDVDDAEVFMNDVATRATWALTPSPPGCRATRRPALKPDQ
jgi:death-on-curing protein